MFFLLYRWVFGEGVGVLVVVWCVFFVVYLDVPLEVRING